MNNFSFLSSLYPPPAAAHLLLICVGSVCAMCVLCRTYACVNCEQAVRERCVCMCTERAAAAQWHKTNNVLVYFHKLIHTEWEKERERGKCARDGQYILSYISLSVSHYHLRWVAQVVSFECAVFSYVSCLLAFRFAWHFFCLVFVVIRIFRRNTRKDRHR